MTRFKTALVRSYLGVGHSVARYWKAYGGARVLIFSPYVHLACLLLLITRATWGSERWWDQVFTILPSLMGFSLGAIAIFLGIGSDSFRGLLSSRTKEAAQSPFLTVTATFTHFVFVQALAILTAVVCAALSKAPLPIAGSLALSINGVARPALWALGYGLFLYALCLAGASVLAIFRVATWFEEHQNTEAGRLL